MEEELNLAYMSVYTGKAGSGAINSGVSLDEIYNDTSLPSEIKNHIIRLGGVSTVSLVDTNQRNVTILAEAGAITSNGTAGTNTVSIQVEEGSNSYAYWLESEGVYYPMSIANGRVVLDKENTSTTEPTGEGSLGSGVEVTFIDSGAAEATSESSFVTKKSTSKSENITTIELEATGAGSTEVVVKSGNIGLTGGNISVTVSPVYTLQFGTMTNGDIVITTGGHDTTENKKYAGGTQIVLTATGDTRYTFDKWYDNGTENTSETQASRNIEVSAAISAVTYTATFERAIGYFKQDGTKAYYYPSQNATAEERIEITNNPTDSIATNPTGKKEYVGNYLGKEVEYEPASPFSDRATYSATTKTPKYRLFYIDVAGKYGDGVGTIYLKQDCDNMNVKIADYDSSGTAVTTLYNSLDMTNNGNKMGQLNPDWETNDGTVNNPNEKAVAYLCNANTWSGYKDNGGKAKYAVGGVPIEMWVDSYNAFIKKNASSLVKPSGLGTNTGELETRYKASNGYQITLKEDSYGVNSGNYTSDYTLYQPTSQTNAEMQERVKMYNQSTSSNYLLASPSAFNSHNVMIVIGYHGYVEYRFYDNGGAFCPLVSIKSEVSIQEK